MRYYETKKLPSVIGRESKNLSQTTCYCILSSFICVLCNGRIPAGLIWSPFQLLRLRSDIQTMSTRTGLSPSPARFWLSSLFYCLRHSLSRYIMHSSCTTVIIRYPFGKRKYFYHLFLRRLWFFFAARLIFRCRFRSLALTFLEEFKKDLRRFFLLILMIRRTINKRTTTAAATIPISNLEFFLSFPKSIFSINSFPFPEESFFTWLLCFSASTFPTV